MKHCFCFVNTEKLSEYNLFMDARREVKILLSKKAWTMKKLAEKLSEASGKHYSQQNLNYRLRTNSLKLCEMDIICQILGFKIIFIEENKFTLN